ncbi:MAG: hypothetical protein PVF50_10060 [Gammaproteobacteria bacterium]|jgi:hypothetical protein
MATNAVLRALAVALIGAPAAMAQDDDSQDEVVVTDPSESVVTPEGESADEPPVSDDVFIPSEEVQAAEELAFPVDI